MFESQPLNPEASGIPHTRNHAFVVLILCSLCFRDVIAVKRFLTGTRQRALL